MSKRKQARSDQIRQRLNQESSDSLRRAKRRLVSTASDQFHSGHVMPLDESISGGKAAVRKKLRPGWRFVSFLLTGLLSFGLFTAWRSPQYKVNAVIISGLQRLAEEEVLRTVDVIGQHIFMVDPVLIEQSVSTAFPELWDIRVQITMPNIVKLQVIERQPLIAWQMEDELLWIDTEGYLIPARGSAAGLLTLMADSYPAYDMEISEDLLEVEKLIQDKQEFKASQSSLSFFAQPKLINKNLLSAILQLNAWMPDEETLLFQAVRGVGWQDVRGWDVFIGQKLENINDKMVMYETIVQKLEKDGINPTLVSVEFLHAPYYRTD